MLEQFIRRGQVMPDGDRHQPAQSGGVEDQMHRTVETGDDIVGEFVHRDDGTVCGPSVLTRARSSSEWMPVSH